MALGDQNDPIPVTQNDTLPKIRVTAQQGPGKATIDVTGATVVFSMRQVTVGGDGTISPGTVVISRAAATVVDGPGGIIEYAPSSAWSANNGLHQAEFEITFPSGGGIFTVPPGATYIWIRVGDDIA